MQPARRINALTLLFGLMLVVVLACLPFGASSALTPRPVLAENKHSPPPAPAPSKKPAPTPAPTHKSVPVAAPPVVYQPVTSQMSLNPFSGPPGQPVTVSGKWFYWHQKLTLYWDTKSHPLATLTTDDQGAFNVKVKPPDDFTGNHTICLVEAPWVPCQVFGLLPRIAATLQLDVAEGQPGTSIAVTGANFDAGQQVNLLWNNTKTLGNLVADANGNVTGRFDIPEANAGAYQLCLVALKPGPNEQPACQQVTVDPVPVAAVNQDSVSLTRVFAYLMIGLALIGAAMFFVASRRRVLDVPNAVVEHRVGPPLMPSTHREYWESMRRIQPIDGDRAPRSSSRTGLTS